MLKNIVITFGIIFINLISFSQQIPNGDFEIWSDANNAQDWNSVNFDSPLNLHSAVSTTDMHQGNFAAELESQQDAIFGQFVPGLITLGDIDVVNASITGGIVFTERPTGISYFFKYLPQGGDTTYMISLLTKWNDATQQTDTIGMTGYFTTDTYDTYTELNVPFVYKSLETPDTLNVIFLSSGFVGTVGSTLLVDDVTLLYGAVISPTLCFSASDTTYNQFTTKCMNIPDASSYELDVSENSDFTSFVLGYEDLNIGADTFAVVDVPTGLYFYRKRVNYGTETSINSNTIAVPMPILNLDATSITSSSFIANWQSAKNATDYYIDVATDESFANIVSGYDNLSVGNVTNYLIENLNSETEYFYRIRTQYDTYTSENSNVISVNTAVGIENIISENINVYSDKDNIVIFCNNEYLPKGIAIYNIQGKQVTSLTNITSSEIIKLRKQGIYIIKLRFNDFVISKKVVLLF